MFLKNIKRHENSHDMISFKSKMFIKVQVFITKMLIAAFSWKRNMGYESRGEIYCFCTYCVSVNSSLQTCIFFFCQYQKSEQKLS